MNYLRSTKRNSNKRIIIAITTVAIVILIMVLVVACNAGNDEPKAEATVPTEETTQTTASTETPTESTTEKKTEPTYTSIGEYKLTAYCGCEICCGYWGQNRPLDENGNTIVYTASGAIAQEGVTVAADLDILPYGTEIYILGHKYTVQDKGGSVNGNTIDIYFKNHQDAVNFGVKYQEVYVESEVETDD